ncbi:hypothetical protein BsIDN1_55520 [Bacillus safensis]|uniref:Aminotransferase class I/classII large domain-containing protein n=1 Tax=Bacillus safensis TaxID=561879 RepID=A0A5S9MID1_BACIA|nr:hypothetical protein BsIDN1_55520 [Bacillus safensis]
MLCSPSNPTGSVYSKEELEDIAQFAKEHDLLIITDEIYAELTYDETFYKRGGYSRYEGKNDLDLRLF